MAVYVCLGTPRYHLTDLESMASTGEASRWTINSRAQVGDDVLFYLTAPVSALVARGVVSSPSDRERDPDADWSGHYMADVEAVSLLPRRVHIRELRTAFPKWGWLASPIKSSRVSDDVIEPLAALIGETPTIVRDEVIADVDDEAVAATEGRTKWRYHLQRERNAWLIAQKRTTVLRATGALACEVCGFDFSATYGRIGEGFCEVHHLIPLAELPSERETRLDDLVIVCSNCHRVIHRTHPMLTPPQLRKRLR